MKDWLRETHSPGFELLRHFLLRFFDSDLVTAPGQAATALIGAVAVFLPWFPVVAGPLREKYAHFNRLPFPGPYREIVRADELWLITLMASAVGLLATVRWQSLFPGLRDYHALGSLPLRTRQIFLAKLLALLLVATGAIVVLNALPSLVFPAVSAGRWALRPLGARVAAHFLSSAAVCYFAFFALTALQGLLLIVLHPRRFALVTGYVQGFLAAAMVLLMVLSFSIQPQIANAALRPAAARWLPPVWFLGLYQVLAGDTDPAMHALACTAQAALAVAVVLVLFAYLAGYRRHRELLVEGGASPARDRRWGVAILVWLVPQPRRQAVTAFMLKTLADSSRHRVILMGYGGFALALAFSGMAGITGTVERGRAAAAGFVYVHVTLLVCLLAGLRQVFSLPMELHANWIFRLTESEGRLEWLHAVDHFVLLTGALAIIVIPFPVEAALLGWRALAEVIQCTALGLLGYEWLFASWEKLPFTCSHLPAKTPPWMLALRLFALLGFLPMVTGILLISLYNPVAFCVVLALLLAAWTRVRAARREGWGDLRLKYEEAPDPAIHGLNLLR